MTIPRAATIGNAGGWCVAAAVIALASCRTPDEAHDVVGPVPSSQVSSACVANLADYSNPDGSRNWGQWFVDINNGCDGYVPSGTWIFNPYQLNVWPIVFRNGATIYGDGNTVSIIKVDNCPYLTANGVPPSDGSCGYCRVDSDGRYRCDSDQIDYAFFVGNPWLPPESNGGDNVTIRDMRLEGTGRFWFPERDCNGAGSGGTAVRFHWVTGGTVSNVAVYKWGYVGLRAYDSDSVQFINNVIDIDGCLTSDPARKNQCGLGGGIELSNVQTPGMGRHVVSGNVLRRNQFEAITIVGSSNNTVLNNTVEDSEFGILLRPSTGTTVRNNRLLNVGGPSYFNPTCLEPTTHYGLGIVLQEGSTGNVVIGNVITNMTSSAASDPPRHAIQMVPPPGAEQAGNKVLANTVTWSVRPSNPNTAGIWNGGASTLIDFNVIKNAPLGIINDAGRTAEVKQNNLANNGQHIFNLGTLSPYSCNRFDGALQGGCSLPGILIGNGTSLSFLTGADCTGNEHVRSATPYTWNSTGSRGTAQVTNFFPSYIDPGGFCHPYGASLSGMFPVVR